MENAQKPRKRIYHMGYQVSNKGDVSPLCASVPRRINMAANSGETWTTDPKAVDCPQCLAKMNEGSVVASLHKPTIGKLITR